MITSVQCMIDKMTLKRPRQSSILSERREHAGHRVPAVFCAVPNSSGPCQERLSTWAFVKSADLLNKYSYTDRKLSHKAPPETVILLHADTFCHSCLDMAAAAGAFAGSILFYHSPHHHHEPLLRSKLMLS